MARGYTALGEELTDPGAYLFTDARTINQTEQFLPLTKRVKKEYQ